MPKEFIRKLIEVEIRMGFINIPKQGIDIMPDQNTKIQAKLGDDSKVRELTYNANYKRIFGLTSWLRENKAKPKDELIISRENDLFKIRFKKQEEDKPILEAKKLIDLSGLSSIAKGDIVEDRIKELILLHGQGLLNVYKPVSDIQGIDLIITKSGIFQPIFIQVKSRFNLQKSGAFLVDIGVKNFNPHHAYFIVGAFFNPEKLEIDDHILLIPTKEIKGKAGIVKPKTGNRYRITTHLNPESKSKWSQYIIKKTELANKLLEKFEEISRYLK